MSNVMYVSVNKVCRCSKLLGHSILALPGKF